MVGVYHNLFVNQVAAPFSACLYDGQHFTGCALGTFALLHSVFLL